jgi:hypothetical protein
MDKSFTKYNKARGLSDVDSVNDDLSVALSVYT